MVQPWMCKNRSSARNAHTTVSAVRGRSLADSRSTKAFTSAPDRRANASAIGRERSSKNRPATRA
jgi:hypothetical protein